MAENIRCIIKKEIFNCVIKEQKFKIIVTEGSRNSHTHENKSILDSIQYEPTYHSYLISDN